MKKITNEQLNILGKIIAEEVLARLPKRTECPKTMSGKHYFERGGNSFVGLDLQCEYCGMRKTK